MSYCKFQLTDEGFIHCPNCNQNDWSINTPEGKLRWKSPDEWPVRHCKIRIVLSEKKESAKEYGPGTELHRLIKFFTRQDATDSCSCKAMIRIMNEGGAAWCREHVDEIVGTMMEQAEKRGLLKSRLRKWSAPKVTRGLIYAAILIAAAKAVFKRKTTASQSGGL